MRISYTNCFLVLTAATALTSAVALAACARDSQVLYCADEHRYVVEASRCDGNDPNVFIYHGYWGRDYRPGIQLNTSGLYSDESGRIPANDRDARSRLGLPATGGYGGNGATFAGGN